MSLLLLLLLLLLGFLDLGPGPRREVQVATRGGIQHVEEDACVQEGGREGGRGEEGEREREEREKEKGGGREHIVENS